jgi:hypothetical protein
VIAFGRGERAAALRATGWLEVRGDGSELYLEALGAFSGLRRLDVREAGRVFGLEALQQVEDLSVWGSTIDLAEAARLPPIKASFDAADLLAPDALADGPRFAELVFTMYPGQAPPFLRADLARLVPSDCMGTSGPVESISPVRGEVEQLQVHAGPALERVSLGEVVGLERLICSNTPKLRVVDGVPDTVRMANVDGAMSDLAFLEHCPLEELWVAAPLSDLSALARMAGTLRAFHLQNRRAAEIFALAPTLRLERLSLDYSCTSSDVVHFDWKPLLERQTGLRSLSLRGYSLESLYELPPLPELEELDVSYGHGSLEYAPLKTLFPKLRRFAASGVGLGRRDATRIARMGVREIVV